MQLPSELDQLLSESFPEALWIAGERHSDSIYTIWILYSDYTYTEWLCSLSFDNRWTVSPRGEILPINKETELQKELR